MVKGAVTVRAAIGYQRVSTADQSDSGLSLDAQRSAITDEAERRGWELVDIVGDVASGKSTKNRPELANALARIEAGQADTLIVSRLDRLSRSVLDFSAMLDRARSNHWSIIVLDLGVDLGSASGELVSTVLAAMAQFERRLIGIRTSEALQSKKQAGARLGRPRLMDPATSARIVEERKAGRTLAAIANGLTADGVPTPMGRTTWYPASIAQALKSAELDEQAGVSAA